MRRKSILALALLSLTAIILFTTGCGETDKRKIANLAITKIEINPRQPQEYQKFTLYLDVSNTGNAKSDSIDVTFYVRKLNQDFKVEEVISNEGVDLGETTHVRSKYDGKWELPFAGDYELKVEVRERGHSELITKILAFKILPK